MVLCGDNVEDDTGGYAVFTEQAAPASHKTAGKVVDTMPQLLGTSGEANDAVSACRPRSVMPPDCLSFPRRNVEQFASVVPNFGMASMTQWSHENDPLARLQWEGILEDVLLGGRTQLGMS